MKDFVLLLPEIFLALTLVGIIASETGYHGEKIRLITFTALLGLAGAFIQTLLSYRYGATQILNHSLSIDGLSLFFKLFFIALAALTVVFAHHSGEVGEDKESEYITLVIASALVMCLAASSADLLIAFLALQSMNVLTYLLAAYGKRSALSTEAGVKHMAFGVVSGALFLYGAAILFSVTQTTNLYEIHQRLLESPLGHEGGLVVFILMFLSLAFQMAAFPMHLWVPDVLEGAPTPTSSFVALGSRAAGIAVALRFFMVVFTQPDALPGQYKVLGELDWPKIIALVSGLTMTLGALLAYRQTAAKRLVAYLVVVETGFLLLGLLVLDEVGLAAILFSLFVQLFALVGAYYVLSFLIRELGSDRLTDLKGMLGRAVPESIALILFLLCLVGVPPLPGFLGKFTLVGAAIRHEWFFLALVAVLAGALSLVAVARLSFSLVGNFPHERGEPVLRHLPRHVFLGALLVPLFAVSFFAEPVLNWVGRSLRFILW